MSSSNTDLQLRPIDEVEAQRRVIVRAVSSMPARELNRIRAALKPRFSQPRLSPEAVGWMVAFHELPFSLSVLTAEGKVEFGDLVQQVSSADGEFIKGEIMYGPCVEWRHRCTDHRPRVMLLATAQRLIAEALNWYPSQVDYLSKHASADSIIRRGKEKTVALALCRLFRDDDLDLLRRALPESIQGSSLSDIRTAQTLASRISGERSVINTDVSLIAGAMASVLVRQEDVVGSKAPIRELLSLERRSGVD